MERYYKILLLLFCAIWLNFQGISQQLHGIQRAKVDSLHALITHTKSDTMLVIRYSEMARLLYTTKNRNEAFEYVEKACKLANAIDFERGKASSYSTLGMLQRENGDFAKAHESLNKAMTHAMNTMHYMEIGYIYSQKGQIYFSEGDTIKSLDAHFKALRINEKIGNKIRQAFACDFIANIYSKQANYKASERYFRRSLEIFKELGNTYRIALSAGNVGLINKWMGNNSEALKYFIISEKHYELDDNPLGIVWINGLIAEIFQEINDVDRSLAYIEKTRKIYEKMDSTAGIADATLLLGEAYYKMEDYNEALKHFNEALKLSNLDKYESGKMRSYLNIGKTLFALKEFQKAEANVTNALKLSLQLGNKRVEFSSKKELAKIFIEQKNYAKAKSYLFDAIQFYEASASTTNLADLYKSLVHIDSLSGDFNAAFEHQKKVMLYSNRNEISQKDVQNLALRYEYEKKEALAQSEIKNKQLKLNISIISTCLMVLTMLFVLLFLRFRKRKLDSQREKLEFQKREFEIVRETEQFKSRFLTNITHEFRTPLTLISGHLEVLRSKGNTEEYERYVEMDNSGKHLLKLINQLLDLAKMESGQYKLQFHQGNILSEAIAYAQAFNALARQKDLEFIVSYDEYLLAHPATSKFNYSSDALMIVINNFVSNAIKFTHPGCKVHVIFELSDDQFLVKVNDNGRGIPAEFLPQVFDRFYQVETPFNKTFDGSGIGLALVKELSNLHGGDAIVESEYGGETTFTAILKNVELESAIRVDEAATEQDLIGETRFNNELDVELIPTADLPLILVTEDQPELRKFIVQNLGTEYRFAEAKDGREGIQIALDLQPDLIISDVMMPKVDGLQLCQELKNNLATSHIPIILLTAKVDNENVITGLEAGADDYLSKPFSLTELKLRVRNIIKSRETLRIALKSIDQSEIGNSDGISDRDRDFLGKINETIEEQLSNTEFSVNDLAKNVFLSSSQLTRKLKVLLEKTPAEMIRNYRLERAVVLLKRGESVAEVAMAVGFDDPIYFSKVFKKHFGITPSSVKEQVVRQ